MAKEVDTAGSAAPFAKFRSIGDTLVGSFGGSVVRQQNNFDTGKPEWKRDDPSKPLKEEILYLVAQRSAKSGGQTDTTVKLGGEESGYREVEDEEIVRFSVAGYKWKQAIDAAKGLPPFRDSFKAGKRVTGDVWMIRLIGFSAMAETEGAKQAFTQAGLPVSEGRVVLRTQEQLQTFVMLQQQRGQNMNPAKDFEIFARRCTDAEKRYEDLADACFDSKPWERQDDVQEAPLVGKAYTDPYAPQDAPAVDSPPANVPDWAKPVAYQGEPKDSAPAPATPGVTTPDPSVQPAGAMPPF